MKRMMLRVAGLMVLFGALSAATAHADTRFSVHVGVGVPVAPPVVVAPSPYRDGYGYAPAPYPGYVWQPGYYVGYRWIPGAWVPRGHYHGHSNHQWRHDDRGWRR
jgi:WXXGXW repeat (2 copies)